MTSVGEILDLIAVDVVAVGVIALAFALLFRHLWPQQPPDLRQSLRNAGKALQARIAQPALFALLLIPAAIAGAVMDVVADELLDGPLVNEVPAIPPELGKLLEWEEWKRGFHEGFKEEDELKLTELGKLRESASEGQLRFLARHIALDGDGATDYEKKVKGLFQHAFATLRASDRKDLLAAIRAESRSQKILRIILIGALLTSALISLGLLRYAFSSVASLTIPSPIVVLREFCLLSLAMFLTLLSLRLWTEQSLRLYKQTLYGYLAVATASPNDLAMPEWPPAVQLRPRIPKSRDVSAVALIGRKLLVATDEGALLHVFDGTVKDGYDLVDTIDLGIQGELDAEAIAVGRDAVYVAGSHSRNREGVGDPKKETPEKNRQKFAAVNAATSRAHLVRVPIGGNGTFPHPEDLEPPLARYESIDLTTRMKDPMLAPFLSIPGKENGIDVEGLAIVHEKGRDCFYAGLRSPVFRDGYAAVLKTGWKPDCPCGTELRFVSLGGLGIRDLTKVDSGFLVLAGPSAEQSGPFELFWWNGEDALSGKAKVERLASVPTPVGSSAEGVAVLGTENGCRELLIVFDGWPNGGGIRQKTCR